MISVINPNICVLIPLTCCLIFVRAEIREVCGYKYEPPEWFGSDSPSIPAEVIMGPVRTIRNAIRVLVKERKENVTLSLFALPYVESQNDCLSAKQVYSDLRKFHRDYTIIAGEDETKFVYIGGIFTGCYYAELTNSKGKKWIWTGVFYNTTYHYCDNTLNCRNNIEGALGNQSMQFTHEFELRLTCLQLRIQLYELDKSTNDSIKYLNNGYIRSSQDCMVTYLATGSRAHVNCSVKRQDNSLELVSGTVRSYGHEGWATVVTWKKLRKNGAFYYSKFELYDYLCGMSCTDLTIWDSAIKIGLIIYGYQNQSSIPRSDNKNLDLHTSIIGILLGVVIMAILVYWVVKYAKIVIERRHKLVDCDIRPQIEDDKIARLNIGKVSDRILLIYAKGPPQFMTSMEEFRNHLQNTCGSTVHDVYSPDDFPKLAELGVSEWVKQRLSEDSKIVWIDTPHFRVLFNGKQQPNTNFRDNAIPYAVKLATDLFQDPATQYCHHFVVRLESHQIENGNADPLIVISPHRRYFIPQHIGLLCDHLTK